MTTPLEAHPERAASAQTASSLFELRVRIPTSWLRDLDEAAHVHCVTRSDLVRLMLREFLSNRRRRDEE